MSGGLVIDDGVRYPAVLRTAAPAFRYADVIGDGNVDVYTHVFDIMTEMSRPGVNALMTKAYAYWAGQSQFSSSHYVSFEMDELLSALDQMAVLDRSNIVDVRYENPAEFMHVRYARTSERVRRRSFRNEPIGAFPIDAHAMAVQRAHYTVATFNVPRLELLWWNVRHPEAHDFLSFGNQGYTKLSLPFRLGRARTVTHLVTIQQTEPISETPWGSHVPE